MRDGTTFIEWLGEHVQWRSAARKCRRCAGDSVLNIDGTRASGDQPWMACPDCEGTGWTARNLRERDLDGYRV